MLPETGFLYKNIQDRLRLQMEVKKRKKKKGRKKGNRKGKGRVKIGF